MKLSGAGCESAVQLEVLKSLTAGCYSFHNASTALPGKPQKPSVAQVSADLCNSGAVDLNFLQPDMPGPTQIDLI